MLTVFCYGAMMNLAIGVNLLPIFPTSLSGRFAGSDPLSREELGRLGAASFLGLVLGILIAGPLADRWGAKSFAVGGNGILAASLVGMSLAPDYGTLGIAVFWLGFGAGILDMVLSPIVAVLNSQRKVGLLKLAASPSALPVVLFGRHYWPSPQIVILRAEQACLPPWPPLETPEEF